MARFITVSSFYIMAAIVLLLYGISLFEAFVMEHFFSFLLMLFIMIFIIIDLKHEWRKFFKYESNSCVLSIGKQQFQIVLIVITSTLITFFLNHSTELGSVVASTLVGLVGAIILPKHEIPIYCGSFVGMSAMNILGSLPAVLLSSAIAGLLLAGTQGLYTGFGGKLGACAFLGTTVGTLVTNQFIWVDSTIVGTFHPLIPVFFIAGTIGTLWIQNTIKRSAVISSAIIGIAGGLILPPIFPDNGLLYATVLYCGTFIGMSSLNKLKRYRYATLAGLVCSLAYFYATPFFPGKGGKLGALAFGASIATAGAVYYFRKITGYYKRIDEEKMKNTKPLVSQEPNC